MRPPPLLDPRGGLPRYDAAFWRELASWGATELPQWFLRTSPGPIGLGVGFSQRRVREQIRQNLRLLHGRRPTVVEMADVAATVTNFAHCLAEGFAGSVADAGILRYTVEGRGNLIRARDARKGAVLVTAHVGSFDVAGGVMRLRDFDLAIAMSPERDPSARAISDEARERMGVRVFHVGSDPLAALPLFQHVRGGGAVALQIDRIPGGMRSRTASFLGIPWSVPLGPFQIAQVTGAPIIPVFTARLGFAHHLVRADPWIHVPRRATERELDEAIGRTLAATERFIRRFPKQWFHFDTAPPLVGEEPSLPAVYAPVASNGSGRRETDGVGAANATPSKALR